MIYAHVKGEGKTEKKDGEESRKETLFFSRMINKITDLVSA